MYLLFIAQLFSIVLLNMADTADYVFNELTSRQILALEAAWFKVIITNATFIFLLIF